jgi:proteasome activator subunit 4
MFGIYFFAYKTVTDEIVKYLKLNPNENHEAFKGALYLIGMNRRHRLMLKPDWDTIHKLWSAFFKTQLSEKHSVIRLMESITDGIHNEFQTITTEIDVNESIAEMGAKLIVNKSKLPPNYLEIGAEKLKIRNEHNKKVYYSLIEEILNYSQSSGLHWRYHLLCSMLINDLMHPVSKYPPEVTRIFVKNLINDSIEERAFALKVCNTILKQQKRKHPKIEIDPFKMTNTVRKEKGVLTPGIREDNKFIWYDSKNFPKSQEQWDEPHYLFKTNGFFGWTNKVEVYAPSAQQPKLDRSYNELSEHEKAFYDFFNDSKNVDKLIEFWSLEEKKGREKFQRSRFWFFKQIFDIFGDIFLDTLIPHVEKLILKKESESSHRCAAELLAAFMRGAKHWNYEKTKGMYEKVTPLIKLALNNITSESDGIWGTAFATAAENIDPKKQYFLHETLLDNPIRETTSFTDCSRLYCLQGAFNQHVWRMGETAHRLLNYLGPFLNHSFQNVRDRIGSTLINIFENDLNFETLKRTNYSPKLEDFLAVKKDELMLLKTVENVNHGEL